MNIANILLVHQNPVQVERLINAMQHGGNYFFIHVDKKADVAAFAPLKQYPSVIFVENRLNVNWGGFSQVKAVVEVLKQITLSDIKFDYVNLLSGQDYPLQPAGKFFEYLEANPKKCFIEFRLPGDHWLKEAEEKLTKYHLTDYNFKGKYFVERLMNVVLPRKKVPKDFVMVGRSTYFTIDMASAAYILDCFEQPINFTLFFKYCWGSDEIVFHTLLYNSGFKDKLVNNNLRYSVWLDGQPRPEILGIAAKDAITKSGAFFARKFDMDFDAEILNYIDKKMLKSTGASMHVMG